MQPLWKTVWRFFKKIRIKLSYASVILLWGIYPKNMKTVIKKNVCITMVIAVFYLRNNLKTYEIVLKF